tara:strand:+ start:524 stop:1024 length:501 start_codon:yes stop_codon:yes gene_type:complete
MTVFGTVFATGLSSAPALLSEVRELRKEVDILSGFRDTKVALSTSFFELMPFPAWLKVKGADGQWRIASLNRSYEDIYGVSELRYKGKTDEEIWGKEIAKQYAENDWKVYISKEPVITKELVNVRGAPELVFHVVAKFPVLLANGEHSIAIGGISIPLSLIQKFLT